MKVRIIAGPNGSGKSTLISFMKDVNKLNFGFLINADDIEKQLNNKQKYTIPEKLLATSEQLNNFLITSTLNTKYNLIPFTKSLQIKNKSIVLAQDIQINSYVSAAIADFLRLECLKQKINFSFESVFSDFRKTQFVRKLHLAGYEIYFYFVCTINASINVARVQNRVLNEGHNVNADKIKSRFQKSIANAIKIKQYTKRLFVIDNSQENNPILLLEIESNKKVKFINKTFFPSWSEPFKL